jgi:hypothetical protein
MWMQNTAALGISCKEFYPSKLWLLQLYLWTSQAPQVLVIKSSHLGPVNKIMPQLGPQCCSWQYAEVLSWFIKATLRCPLSLCVNISNRVKV